MGRKATLAKNTLIFSIGTILPRVSVFITLPILTRYLTKEEYGVFDLVSIILPSILPLLTLNIYTAAFRFLIDVRDNNSRIKNIISNTLNFSLTVSAVTLPFLFYFLPGSFLIRILICFYMLMSLINGTVRLFARGIGRNLDYSLNVVIDFFLKMIFIITFVWYYRTGLMGAVVAVFMASTSSVLFLIFKINLYRYFSLVIFNMHEIKQLISYSLPTMFSSLIWWIIRSSDRFVITLFIDLAANGAYAVAHKIPAILNIAQGTFNMAWAENATLAMKDSDASAYYSSTFRDILDFMGGILGLIICFSPILFTVLVRGNYSDAYSQMPILFLASFFSIINGVFDGIYTAYKNMKGIALTAIYGAICNLVINLALIKFIGLYAASLSTLLSYIVMAVIRMKDIRKMVNIKYDYRHIAFIITVMILQASLCFMRNIFLDALNIVIGITFFTVLNKKMMITLWNKSLGKIRQKLNLPLFRRRP